MAWKRWNSARIAGNTWGQWFRRFRSLNPGKGIGVLAALGGLIWLGAQAADSVQRARSAFPTESGRLEVAGLTAPVSMLRDARGIPHVEALTDRDAWLALGVAHAQDRLAQMLWLRRLARGKTAEVLGKAGLATDRMARTLGLGRLADAEMARLVPESREVLEAYSAGVNARIRRVRAGELSPPLALQGEVSEILDWQAADSIAVLKLIAWSASNRLETGVVLDELIRVLGGGLAAPFRPGGIARMGESALTESPEPRGAETQGTPKASAGHVVDPGQELVRATRIGGGTAWVLGGRHTESGRPILVADLNLPATTPSLVYEAHLQSREMDVVGATIPGIPLFWMGRNFELAWAAIPAGVVTVDLYLETVRDGEGVYHDGSRWVPLGVRREVIRVRHASGFLEEEVTIRSTHHGPLVNSVLEDSARIEAGGPLDEAPGVSNPPIALAWTGQEEGNGFSSLLALARASDGRKLRAALANHHEPVVAVVYADADGDAGVQLAGWLPQRMLPSGLVPVPARMRIYDWRGAIPYDSMPAIRFDASNSSAKPGSRGWVAFSDGDLDSGSDASGIEWLWRPGARARRLAQSLSALTTGGMTPPNPDRNPANTSAARRADLRSAAALQKDLVVSDANEVVPAILRLARIGGPLPPEAEEIANLLSRWDGNLGAESSGAAAYSVLNRHLFAALFQSELGDSLFRRYLDLPGVRPSFMVGRVLLAADRYRSSGGWADLQRVVTGLRESLRLTWVTLTYRLGPSREDWIWGGLHRLDFHPFAGTDPGRRGSKELPAFGIGGNANTLASSRSSSMGFEVASASTYRLAVDLASSDRLLSSLAPGQSEHHRHPHWFDGARRWLEGRPNILLTSRLYVEEESAPPLLLEPAP